MAAKVLQFLVLHAVKNTSTAVFFLPNSANRRRDCWLNCLVYHCISDPVKKWQKKRQFLFSRRRRLTPHSGPNFSSDNKSTAVHAVHAQNDFVFLWFFAPPGCFQQMHCTFVNVSVSREQKLLRNIFRQAIFTPHPHPSHLGLLVTSTYYLGNRGE